MSYILIVGIVYAIFFAISVSVFNMRIIKINEKLEIPLFSCTIISGFYLIYLL